MDSPQKSSYFFPSQSLRGLQPPLSAYVRDNCRIFTADSKTSNIAP